MADPSGAAPRRRVGLFGGSFDPPHLAHVALARAAVEQLGLDTLHVLPTGQAWHKARSLSPAEHRLALARLAFDPVPRARVDARELRREGPTYTIDTLRELRREHPDAELVLVIGADQAEALHGWRDSAEIPRLATLAIAERARPSEGPVPFDASHVPGGTWESVELPPMPVSATAIRALVGAGEPIDTLVPEGVARYIDQHHLYRSP
ncbi:nicotinate (nicotinamide) nucleotide adenylyltransferase [Ramlibacter rhizophilus]|uniref:Probable nicotinate-nucleotide adenylyltransferase n=2 Tax=Ramlibacter rhizophilus TaxID=1781167 RepID=A0A4Z0C3P4_9BURK|nr:nicotinate (nicotinamide) nucleotide adenylyltransferase [Ramlibacter rhizophilus]TFZ05090.1 nicotinate (nicotinamide) nucleotide adenylyltransferase [Ramlibacter rhizophilus]